VNHTFTEEELQTKLKRSGVLRQKFISLERSSLNARRKEAEYNSDTEAIAKIDEQLRALEGPKLAFGTSLYKAGPQTPQGKTQQQRLAEINAANRKLNTQNVRKAQIKERKAEALRRAAVERGEAAADPFARVKIAPKTHFNADDHLKAPKKKLDDLFDGGSDTSRAATPASGALTGTATPVKRESRRFDINEVYKAVSVSPGPPERSSQGPEEKTANTSGDKKQKDNWLQRKPCDDEVLASMDFGIDIDVF
jgi:RNA polymerase-associated protein RTF1